MNIIDITNKDEFSAIIINELKAFGVKYQKEKKKKIQVKLFNFFLLYYY